MKLITQYICLLVCLFTGPWGRAFEVTAGTDPVPVERLIKNAERVLKKNPNSAEWHYTLSRIHYLAFSRDLTMLPVFIEPEGYVSSKTVPKPKQKLSMTLDDDPRNWAKESLDSLRAAHARKLAVIEVEATGISQQSTRWYNAVIEAQIRHQRQLEQEHWNPPAKDAKVMAKHAAAALKEMEAALKLQPENPLYLLGLANLSEQIVDWTKTSPKTKIPSALVALDYDRARDLYLRAFRIAFSHDGKLKDLPSEVREDLLSYEASRGYIRLYERDRERFKGDKNSNDALTEIRQSVAKLDSLKYDGAIRFVSPMVFSLEPVTGVAELLDPTTHVTFDLVGHGLPQQWPWVGPKTGLLVWDPEKRGEITSGRQLFGNYTFQIFRKTGYDALAALDDDGDGLLRGSELGGVRVWFDTNSDGRSEPSEVHDLVEFNIVAIAVCATGYDGVHPTCSAGILLSNGKTLPTWDWMVSPIKE